MTTTRPTDNFDMGPPPVSTDRYSGITSFVENLWGPQSTSSQNNTQEVSFNLGNNDSNRLTLLACNGSETLPVVPQQEGVEAAGHAASDEQNRITTTTNADGTTTHTTHYADGSTSASTVQLDGSTLRIDTNADGTFDLRRLESADGRTVTLDFADGRHRVIERSAAGTSVTTYGPNGRLSTQTWSGTDGSSGESFYDRNGRLQSESRRESDGSAYSREYYADGTLQSAYIRNANGSSSLRSYGSDGRMESQQITNVDGTSRLHNYYANGQIAATTNFAADGSPTYSQSFTETGGILLETTFNRGGGGTTTTYCPDTGKRVATKPF